MKQQRGAVTQQRSFLAVKLRVMLVLLAWLAGLMAATQFFAWYLKYQEALGSHIGHLYWPWAILAWAAKWWHVRPDWFVLSGSVGVMTSATLLIVLTLRDSFSIKTNAHELLHGSARWANEDDLEKAGVLREFGVYVGGWENEWGQQRYLRHNGSEHVLCIAPTRSGKGICLVVPTLLSWTQSCVITDLKGELWALTAGWRKEYAANKVLRFEPATKGHIRWNPLDEIRLGTDYEIGDAQNLATMIVDPDGKGLEGHDAHWKKTAQALLTGCILYLLYKRSNNEPYEASLPDVDAMLSDSSRPIKKLWEAMLSCQDSKGRPSRIVAQSAQDMLDRPDQEAGSVLSTAKSYLALYRDPIVAENVRESDFHVTDLMAHNASLYIITQPADKVRLKPLVRILINMICRILAERMGYEDVKPTEFTIYQKIMRVLQGKSIRPTGGGRRAKSPHKNKLLMMMDEFPSLGKLGIVQESLAFLAGYDIRFYIICQDINQLRSEETGYGKDEAISSNCHIQNAFQPNRLETAQYLSKLTGQTTVVKEQITISGQRMGLAQNNVSRVLQEVSRPLMTEDECLRMPPPVKDGEMLVKGGEMLVYVAGFPAIRGRQMPYFLDPVFQARSQVSPPEKSDSFKVEVSHVET